MSRPPRPGSARMIAGGAVLAGVLVLAFGANAWAVLDGVGSPSATATVTDTVEDTSDAGTTGGVTEEVEEVLPTTPPPPDLPGAEGVTSTAKKTIGELTGEGEGGGGGGGGSTGRTVTTDEGGGDTSGGGTGSGGAGSEGGTPARGVARGGASYASVATRAAVIAAGRALDLAGPLSAPIAFGGVAVALMVALGRGPKGLIKVDRQAAPRGRAYRL